MQRKTNNLMPHLQVNYKLNISIFLVKGGISLELSKLAGAVPTRNNFILKK